MTKKREQQKLWLTRDARTRLREEAKDRDCELSDVAEHLIMNGEYGPSPSENDDA